jgi:hypothetical protein
MSVAPRDPNLIIDDLGFRMAWLEKTVVDNINRLEAIAARKPATQDALRQAARDLADDTRKNLAQLQVCAVERLLVQQREPAAVLDFRPKIGEPA